MNVGQINITPAQEGSMAGAIAGSLIPIPGGSAIGAIIGNLLGTIIGGKPSNFSAYAWFSAGPIPVPKPAGVGATRCVGSVCGTEMNAATQAAATAVSNTLAQMIQAYAARGVRWNSPAFGVVIGQRDGTSIHHAATDGQFYATNIAPVGDLHGATLGVWEWLAQYATPPINSVDQMYSVPPPAPPGQYGYQPPGQYGYQPPGQYGYQPQYGYPPSGQTGYSYPSSGTSQSAQPSTPVAPVTPAGLTTPMIVGAALLGLALLAS